MSEQTDAKDAPTSLPGRKSAMPEEPTRAIPDVKTSLEITKDIATHKPPYVQRHYNVKAKMKENVIWYIHADIVI